MGPRRGRAGHGARAHDAGAMPGHGAWGHAGATLAQGPGSYIYIYIYILSVFEKCSQRFISVSGSDVCFSVSEEYVFAVSEPGRWAYFGSPACFMRVAPGSQIS